MEEQLDITGMTWFGALATVILLMISFVKGRRKRFDRTGYTRSELAYMIHETVFSERDRAVAMRRLCDGLRMEELAEEFHMSVPQIKRIVYASEEALARFVQK